MSQKEYTGPAAGNSYNQGRDETSKSSNFDNKVLSRNLLKGGGTLKGQDEKFTSSLLIGTGSMTVSIAINSGRLYFGPQLSLSYDSYSGMGSFALGCGLSLPFITCKTDKGLSRNLDWQRQTSDKDEFNLSEVEDLIPEFAKDDNDDRVNYVDKYIIWDKPQNVNGIT